MKLSELTRGLPLSGDLGKDPEVFGVRHDSRFVTPGELFVAWRGARFDGASFAADAVMRGAVAVLADHRPAERGAAAGVPWLVAESPRALLAALAAPVYGHPDRALRMIGVTGTNGKSTVVELSCAICDAAGLPAGRIGTLGARFPGLETTPTDRTTPEASDIFRMLATMARLGAKAAAMEVSSHALVQGRVDGIEFDVGVFTNLTRDHFDFHTDFEDYFAAKSRLFDQLKPAGRAVIHLDDPYGARLAARIPDAIGFGASAAVAPAGLRLDACGVHGRVATPRGAFDLESPLLGRYNLENLLAAVGVGEALELPHEAVASGIAATRPLPGRMEPVAEGQEFLAVVDFAHTPAALEAAIRSLKELLRRQGRARLRVRRRQGQGQAGTDGATCRDAGRPADRHLRQPAQRRSARHHRGGGGGSAGVGQPELSGGAGSRRSDPARRRGGGGGRMGDPPGRQGTRARPDRGRSANSLFGSRRARAGAHRARRPGDGGLTMLLQLLYPLHERFAVFNVVRYLTFRTAAATVTALLLSLLCGPWFVRTLRRLSVGQNVRDVGPQSHLVKAGTPTMGGLLILFAWLVATLLWANLTNPYVWLAIEVSAGFGLIGFADDLLKVRRKRNLGLTARSKMLLQILVAGAAGVALPLLPAAQPFSRTLAFPFFKDLVVDLGALYVPFVVFVLVGSSNAVNLTDGLDGLAIGAAGIAAGTYAIFCYVAGNRIVAGYLQLPSIPGVGEVTIFCGALVGAALGFLWFNAHPAEVFMGDVGSLALGGGIAIVAVMAKQEILLALVGGLFVMEALSVIVQVGSFKLRGKRVFRMAPLHHHFELLRLGRAEDHRSFLDPGVALLARRALHPQAPMNATSSSERWRRAYVLGLGLSGTAAARLLRSRGVAVVASDRCRADELDLESLAGDEGVELRLGRDDGPLPEGLDGVVVSPGVAPAHPILVAARAAGLPILAEVELAFRWLEGTVVAITGSNGKSTTTALAGALIAGTGRAVEVCGNIGAPLAGVVDGAPGRIFVVELSSFQLEAVDRFHARAAALLNLSPDHLDRHGDLAGYLAAKRRVFRNQTSDDVAVLNGDEPEVAATPVGGRRRLFSRLARVADGCCLDGDRVVERAPGEADRELFRIEDVPLPGPHNLENAMAAALLARAVGVVPETIAPALRVFQGLPHRLERVAERAGVVFYDDSKGTNVAATARSLEGFPDRNVHVILGGRNKGADFRYLREVVARKVKRAYLIGESAGELATALAGATELSASGTLAAALTEAAERARAGEAVVLSPACASFDQFRNYADRGEQFQRLAAQLAAATTRGGGHGQEAGL